MEKDFFEDLIKEKVVNHEVHVDNLLWNSVSAQVGIVKTGFIVSAKALVIGMSGAALVAAATYLYFQGDATTSIKREKKELKPNKSTTKKTNTPPNLSPTENQDKPQVTILNYVLKAPEAIKTIPLGEPFSETMINSNALTPQANIVAPSSHQATILLPEPIHTESTKVLNIPPKTNLSVITEVQESQENMKPEEQIMPNTFTPNGDGINDELILSLEGLTDVSFVVLDKNNKVVYSSTQTNVAWDGKIQNGDLAPAGIYHYFFTGKDLAGQWVNKQSTLTIIR